MRQQVTMALIAALPCNVAAQQTAPGPGAALNVRAVRDDVQPSLVKWLAENAVPTRLPADAYPDLPAQTGNDVASALCGRTTESYWAAFRAENKRLLANGFDAAARLGAAAHDYAWPACFYVEQGDFSQVVSGSEDVAAKVYKRETGSEGKPRTWSNFFSRSNIRDLGALSTGQVLRFGFKTRPNPVAPRAGDLATFSRELNSAASRTVGGQAAANVVTTAPPPAEPLEGEVVMGASDQGSTATVGAVPADCVGRGGPPFDVARASAAFGYGDQPHPDQVQVVVVDNGFFGATRANGKLTFAPRFAPRFFRVFKDTDGNETIGPTLSWEPGRLVTPFNRENGFAADAAPDPESGHGTHVAGLIAAGAAMSDQVLFDPSGTQSWMRVSVVAFSPGKRAISNLAVPQFDTAIRQIRLMTANVVNMSVRFGSGVSDQLRALVNDRPGTLFVVAAGNQGVDFDQPNRRAYPAMLGGDRDNVLTVAAEDGGGNLSVFSNRGAGFVDIAAPGCNLPSTLDGVAEAPLSGTSQAAPVVTLAAALLSRQMLRADQIKRRLVQSGDLLTGMLVARDGAVTTTSIVADTEVPIRSRSRLNLAKAQFASVDYLRYRNDGGVVVEAVGRLGARKGPPCGRASRSFQDVVAFKRLPTDGSGWCFWKGSLEPVVIPERPDATLDFEVAADLDATGRPTPNQKSLTGIALSRVHEFVMSAEAADLASRGE